MAFQNILDYSYPFIFRFNNKIALHNCPNAELFVFWKSIDTKTQTKKYALKIRTFFFECILFPYWTLVKVHSALPLMKISQFPQAAVTSTNERRRRVFSSQRLSKYYVQKRPPFLINRITCTALALRIAILVAIRIIF